MKKIVLFIAALSLFSCVEKSSFNALQYVDPNIGSVHGRWFYYTPAAAPWGMAKLAPNTNAYMNTVSWEPCGYDDRHTSIEGFAHFHEFQIAGVATMPTTGDVKTVAGTLDNPDSGFRSRFDKDTEHAEAGYYTVLLKDYGVKVELTATDRVGFHRYTFPESDNASVLFDVGHRLSEGGDIVNSAVTFNAGDNTVSGYVESYPVYATFCDTMNYTLVYFFAEIDKQPVSVDSFIDSLVTKGSNHAEGIGAGLKLNFTTKEAEQLHMKVGLSYTSIDGAKANLLAEAKDKSFDQVRSQTQSRWNELLSRIEVETKNTDDLKKFYTGLYHVLLGRGISSDHDGKYIRNDKTIGQVPIGKDGKPEFQTINTDGIWGGFWNLTQLWTIAYPEYFESYVRSQLAFYKDNGWFHDGTAAGVYTNGVQTNFQGLIACAAYQAGILRSEIETAYEGAYKNDMGYENRDFGSGRYDNIDFVNLGYVPLRTWVFPNPDWDCNFGTSHTLEYAFSAYATSQFALALGKRDDFERLKKYAYAYQNIFDKETKFIRSRNIDGTFADEDVMQAWNGYQEGNAFQYTWYVPQDVAGLIELMGKEEFNKRLEHQFEVSRSMKWGGGDEIGSFSGIEKLYNHGNQPCLNQVFLFNYSGKPWLTQQMSRQICDEFYGATPMRGCGVGQDEDQGQLSAWFNMVSMGLFDVQGGTRYKPTFQLGSPLFDKVTINLNKDYHKGEKFVIETTGNAKENYFIQSAILNGKPLENCWFEMSEMLDGGKLTLTMGAVPNEGWGVATPPPSLSTDNQ